MATSSPETALGPVRAGERILTLDVLRGIALFGVLAANIASEFSGMRFLPFSAIQGLAGTLSLDGLAFHAENIFVEGKARTTFAFLFGLGFAVQMMRAEEKGRRMAPMYVRRLTVLFWIGVVHATLLYWGDILFRYAALGFVLLLFRKRTDRALLVWAAVLMFVVPPAYRAAPFVIELVRPDFVPAAFDAAAAAEQRQAQLQGFASGEPGQIAAANVQALRQVWSPPLRNLVSQMHILAIFLLGYLAGRRRVFHEPATHRVLFRRLVVWGLPLGLVATLVVQILNFGVDVQPPAWFFILYMTLDSFAMLAMAAGYIAAATLLLEHAVWRPWLAHFGPVGRMALTNYVAQSVICVAIFYVGGLVTSPRPALSLMIAVGVFATQIGMSAWWLARFRFGPLEWVWRSLSYGRLQPMRIPAPRPAPGVAS
jgi:uncharacterized protein